MKDVTLLIAHPDDEALFAWPILDRVKHIICASDDSLNPSRAWCRERGKCLEDVGKLIGADVAHLPNDSEFYRLPTRNGDLKCLADVLLGHLRHAEIVFTHNAWGEYGNLDHILCHHIGRTVQAETGCEMLTTDIAVTEHPAWLPIRPWVQSELFVEVGTGETIDITCADSFNVEHEIDRPLFDRIKAIYDKRGCWTWSFEPVERCRVYSL